MNIKQLIISLLLIFPIIEVSSQTIAVKSFRKLDTDQEARISSPKTDQNGKKCAVIKVVTSQTGFVFDFGLIGNAVATEQKTAEIWVWVPAGARKVTIKHQQLGVLRDYPFDVDIEEATVYEMVLITGKVETIVKEEIGSEWVVITSDPTGADVYIDERATGMQTPFSRQYPLGSHSYRLSLDLYHPDAGKFELTPDAGKKRIITILKPNFGQLQISSLPESGATIVLDGKTLMQTTPHTIDQIKSGDHTIALSKTLYHETSQTITINDAQTTTLNSILKPAFGSISVTSTPESGASVTLDDIPTGQVTPYIFEKIPSGVHNISLRQEWYQPVKKQVTVGDGESAMLDVLMNALFGTINITTAPEADIYIDDSKIATGSYSGRLNEGIYTIEARKPKHTSDIQKVQIATADQKYLTLAPKPQLGTLEIQSTPIEATISLDGVDKGTTPATLRNLLIGDYSLTLSLANHAQIKKIITVIEGQTTQLNDTLVVISNTIDYSDNSDYRSRQSRDYIYSITSSTEQSPSKQIANKYDIYISSYPTGARLEIDGKYVGYTPYTAKGLNVGTHNISIMKGTLKSNPTIIVSYDGNRKFHYNLQEKKN